MTKLADVPITAPAALAELHRALDALRRNCLAEPIAATPTAQLVLDAALATADDTAAEVLEHIVRKVEVGRALRTSYSGRLDTPLTMETVPPAITGYLAALLVVVGLARGDWKFLNSAIKMEGGILKNGPVKVPEPFDQALRRALGEAA